jgi:outer membrane protein OmpA-like peptidoglycan-associated protein
MKSRFVLPITIFSLTLAGCTTTNPYTREEQTAKATSGAAIGAAAGAVIGLISGDNSRDKRQKALVGAGIGALAGGGVGYYMDTQEAKLRQQLDGTGVSVSRYGDEIVLNMPGNVTFDTDRSEIRGNFYPILDSVILILNEYQKTMIEITGHTDSTGDARYNQLLSERRADSVANYLRSRNVLHARIATQGLGENSPVASNDTPQGRAQNRRVELRLVPITG